MTATAEMLPENRGRRQLNPSSETATLVGGVARNAARIAHMALLAGRHASLLENPKFRKVYPRLCAVSRRHDRTVVQSHSLDRRKSRATSTDLRQRRIPDWIATRAGSGMRKADPARGLRCGVTTYWPRLMPGLPSSQEATANVVDPPMRT